MAEDLLYTFDPNMAAELAFIFREMGIQNQALFNALEMYVHLLSQPASPWWGAQEQRQGGARRDFEGQGEQREKAGKGQME